jgi:hypothetical protein
MDSNVKNITKVCFVIAFFVIVIQALTLQSQFHKIRSLELKLVKAEKEKVAASNIAAFLISEKNNTDPNQGE